MRVIPSSGLRPAVRGFTLIELLMTLVIIAIGLLGVAKLQAAAIAETGVARTRSLMTFQAEALAAAMRSNEAFWQSSTAFTQSIQFVAGGTFTQLPATMVKPTTSDGTCQKTTSCSSANLAYDDVVNTWLPAFAASFPSASGTIVCNGSATTPETCDITLTWTDKQVAINRTTAAGTAQTPLTTSSMILHIQP